MKAVDDYLTARDLNITEANVYIASDDLSIPAKIKKRYVFLYFLKFGFDLSKLKKDTKFCLLVIS